MSLLLEVSETQIIALLSQMPPEQRTRILAPFVPATNTATNGTTPETKPPIRPRAVFGSGKDHIRYIADDFDAPLDEMKEYRE